MRADTALLVIALVGLGAVGGAAVQQGAQSVSSKVTKLDQVLDQLVASDATIDQVVTGFVNTEGPFWVQKRDPHLLFVDIPGNALYRWSRMKGLTRLLAPVFSEDHKERASVGPGAAVTDADGRVVFTELGNRRVSRLSSDGRLTILADRYQGHRLNGPNDLAFKSDSWLYFTDPWLGVVEGRELDFNGVYRISPRGDLQLLNQELTAPNGLAFSPDEKRLYVAESRKRNWMVYDVNAQGELANGRIFLDLAGIGGTPPPDGFKVDERGNVWSSGPGGIWIISPDGRHLGTIQVPERCLNLAFGDTDRRTLYMTAATSVYRMRVKVRGAAIPFS